MKRELGPTWKDTVVVVMTEFGRTARVNGTQGTDHGTSTVMLLVGGAVRGGRVIADWPGLRSNQLREGRDLAPTTDVRNVMKGVAAELLGAPTSALQQSVFPGSSGAPLQGLIA